MEDQRAEEIWWENEIRSGRDPSKYRGCPMGIPATSYHIQYMPYTLSFFGMCGCSGPQKIVKEDCYFYHEEPQMGATIPTCSYHNKGLGDCPCEECKKYISRSDVYKMVKESAEKEEMGE